ncbi:MAG: MBL fold metallo-hydrolase [Anaerolineae bacterium]|nr:MBL fold metallo-hydrolase [Anaerolineae bacterium]
MYTTNAGVFLDAGEAYLLDPGITPTELDAVATFVAAHGADVRGIVVTHAHWDHLLGPTRFPRARVFAAAGYAAVVSEHGDDLVRQVAAWRSADGQPGLDVFVPPAPDVMFDDRICIHLGARSLRLMIARGHAPDHVVLYEPSAGLLWAGDMLSDVEIPMVMDTFSHYLQTLDRLSHLDVRVLVPGHGTVTDDAVEIRGRFERDQAYLAAMRECVAHAVADGASLIETVTRCSEVQFAQPDTYPNAHLWNIEQAYSEMGGRAPGVVGWAQDWLTEGAAC